MRRELTDIETKELETKDRGWYLKTGPKWSSKDTNPEYQTLMVTKDGVYSLQELYELLPMASANVIT